LDINVSIGLSSTIESIVMQKDTASEYGSGGVDVFATPAMIGFMEKAAMSAVELHLGKGYSTVGTTIDIKHIAATPVGMKIKAKAQLIEVDGKKLVFKVEAYDERELIGEGLHERYIINLEKFMERVNKKLNL
jgi:fluoroacetyl-CoA thioesterase